MTNSVGKIIQCLAIPEISKVTANGWHSGKKRGRPGVGCPRMGLFQYILHGFGFTLGARAANEALEQLEKKADDASRAEAQREKRARAEAKANAKLQRKRAREKARRESEVAQELESLKKRVSRER